MRGEGERVSTWFIIRSGCGFGKKIRTRVERGKNLNGEWLTESELGKDIRVRKRERKKKIRGSHRERRQMGIDHFQLLILKRIIN